MFLQSKYDVVMESLDIVSRFANSKRLSGENRPPLRTEARVWI